MINFDLEELKELKSILIDANCKKSILEKIDNDIEYILKISQSARESYEYAKDILNSRFELGEPVIATNPFTSFYYAKEVLKGRFKLGEKIIATEAEYSYLYAKYVLKRYLGKRRFKLGEPAIATNPCYSYYYALDVLKRRFKLGEPIIAKNNKSYKEYYENRFNIKI